MTDPVPPMALSPFTTINQTFEQDVRTCQDAGVRFMDVAERKLADDPDQAAVQMQLLEQAGLEVSAFIPTVHALYPDTLNPDLHNEDDRVERFRASIARAEQLGVPEGVPILSVTGAAPRVDLRSAWSFATQAYAALAEDSAARGFRLMIEPLHPMFMNTDTFICTLREASRLVDEVANNSFGIAVDTFHVWDEEGVCDRIVEASDRVFAVHVSDWPHGGPRGFADRAVPGDGVIPLASLFGAVAKAGFGGPLVLEIFSDLGLEDSLWRVPPREVLARSERGIAKAWSARS